MRSNLRFWLALSVLLVAGGLMVWMKGRRGDEAAALAEANEAAGPGAPMQRTSPLLTLTSVAAAKAQAAQATTTASIAPQREPYQLSNVALPLAQLSKLETAVLMRNALIDTREFVDLPIPAALKAGENPGAYIVQAKGASTAAFQEMLKASGAKIVAYIPNNAFLVSADKTVADALNRRSGVQSVLPYEPYYKLDTRLMRYAVDGAPMPDEGWLRITLFPGQSPDSLTDYSEKMGATEKFIFGEQVLILPRAGALADIARAPSVQLIEPWTARVAANDLTRVALGVSEDTITNANRYQLTGSNQWVNVNDVGVDSTHPDLTGRVFYDGINAKVDIDGHGTHVAATIAGGGKVNPVFDGLDKLPTNSFRTNYLTDGTAVTNILIDGSLTNASFRGMAPLAKLFVLPVDFNPDVNKAPTDSYLIETAAATNYLTLARDKTLISNNSWNYDNAMVYDTQAARYDAATRDALTKETGSQPVLYVFAAGNHGQGDVNGTGGSPGGISSPGTAKNVLTIGALETPRVILEGLTNITSTVDTNDETGEVFTNSFTNVVSIFRDITDSASQVAPFSSRGNVGIAVEGPYGRFKPDLVAPGTFIFSARSSQWKLENDFNPTGFGNESNIFQVLSNLNMVASQYRYDSGTSFSAPGVSGVLALLQEFFTETLQKEKRRNMSPALMKAYLINSARSVSPNYDLQVQNTINYQGWGEIGLDRLIPANTNNEAIMMVKDEPQWPIQLIDQSANNALITGEVQRWSIDIDTNITQYPLRLTLAWTDPPANPAAGVKLVNDLDLVVEAGGFLYHGNDISGGRTFTEARSYTDDTNTFNGILDDTYRDNINNVENILIGELPNNTTNITVWVIGRHVNVKAVNDFYAINSGGTNVDQAHQDAAPFETAQDYALVIASDDTQLDKGPFKNITRIGGATNYFKAKSLQMRSNGTLINALEVTNRVGANGSFVDPPGYDPQWNFYVFTNTYTTNSVMTNGTKNVVFVLSAPVNVGIPRNLEPDIDLYVSTNKDLTNLTFAAVNGAYKSTTRGGSEQLIFRADRDIPRYDAAGTLLPPSTNPDDLATLYPEPGGVITNVPLKDQVFYVAVKSEDKQAADYSLIVISTDLPLEEDRNGTRVLHFYPNTLIPDGFPNYPGGLRSFAFPLRDGRILNADTYVAVAHEELGDLVGHMRHDATRSVLMNHSLNNGNFTGTNNFYYSDYPYMQRPRPLPPAPASIGNYLGMYPDLHNSLNNLNFESSSGPGLLASYAGQKMLGAWTFEMVDDAAGHTGALRQAEMHIVPMKKPLVPGETYHGTVPPGDADIQVLDVPVDATSMTITISQDSGNADMTMFVQRDVIPSTNTFDYSLKLTNGVTSTLTVDFKSDPPLTPGATYFLAIYNPGTVPADYTLMVSIEHATAGANATLVQGTSATLRDDATTTLLQDSTPDKIITDVAVAVVSTNARVSDMVLHLISPQGTRVLLTEARGGSFGDGFGYALDTGAGLVPDTFAVFTDHPELADEPIKFVSPFDYRDFALGPIFNDNFDGLTPGDYDAPTAMGLWKVETNSVSVVDRADAHTLLNYVDLRAGTISISNSISLFPGRSYKLRFAYRAQGTNLIFNTGKLRNNTLASPGLIDSHYALAASADASFTGSDLFVANTNAAPVSGWNISGTNSEWITITPSGDNGHPPGRYVFRTTFVWTNTAFINIAAAFDRATVGANVGGATIIINGTNVAVMTNGPNNLVTVGPFVIKEGLNTIDFQMDRSTAGPIGLRAEITPLPAGPASTKAVPSIAQFTMFNGDTNSVSLTGGADWRIYEQEFVARTNDLALRFAAFPNSPGMEIDTVQVIDTGIVYIQPEEPLDVLIGQRSMGEWRLEALDNRTGAPVPAELVTWQVLLKTAPAPRLAEAVSNLATYTNRINNPTIRSNFAVYTPGWIRFSEVEWFYFDVCPNATRMTIQIFTPPQNLAPLELLVDRSGFPTGNPETDDYAPGQTLWATNSTFRFTLSTTNPAAAPLIPGKRIFFGVRNYNPFLSNRFALNVNSDGNCPFVTPSPLLVNRRVDNVAFPSDVFGNGAERYQLVTDGPSSIAMSVDEGSLTVLASSKGEPTIDSYEVKQTVSANGTIALPSGGVWNVKVFNPSDNAIQYSMTVSGSAGVAINNVAITGGKLTVTWTSLEGASYEIATSTDLVNWNPITTIVATADQTTFTDSANATAAAKFYRIRPLN